MWEQDMFTEIQTILTFLSCHLNWILHLFSAWCKQAIPEELPLLELHLFLFNLIANKSLPKNVAGYPSLAITFFLHEAYGEERILKVLDFFQRPPWQYHHTESCGRRTGGIHITSSSSPANALMRPYLLPSRDFYSLGAGMPVWGVRPVHCGGEILRVTLYSGYDNYEDAVRLYETVLQRQAEEQKTGFCWFTLHTGTSVCDVFILNV